MSSRHHHRELLSPQCGLALSANAGGVYQSKARSFVFEVRVHGVASGAGYGRNNHALLAAKPIYERRLAHVGTAHNRKPDRFAFNGSGLNRRKHFDHSVEQFRDSVPVLGGDWKDFVKPPTLEFVSVSLELLRVDFVGNNKDRVSGVARQFGQAFIERGYSGSRVNYEQDQRGIGERQSGLLKNVRGNQFFVFGYDPSGVDQPELPASPIGGAVDPIACYPRFVTNDGAPAPGNLIEQGRLPDVRPSEYDDAREAFA